MAIQNPKIFGLNVLSFLSDIQNKDTAIRALGLDPNDLEVIRGAANAGATRPDWTSYSRLSVPIYNTMDRYYYESAGYQTILDTKAGVDAPLRGNLNINGALSGSSIRYRFVSGTGSGATIKIADISTSRLSAWSSFASPVVDSSPIFYGARVGIITSGYLEFGTPTNANQTRLQTTTAIQAKEFNSEFPTSKILCSIGGKNVVLYAMKGIPLIFEGVFRNVDATIRLTSLINNTPPSWKIVDIANPNVATIYRNRGGVTSTINYRSSSSKPRYIQYYYNPDNVSQITLQSAGLTSLPESVLQNLTILNVSFNSIKDLQNLSTFTPNLQQIYFIRNPLFQSSIETERKLNSAVLNKLPTSLRQLHFGSTFYGSISPNIFQPRFSNLTTLNLSRNGNPYFHPDTENPTCPIPNVPNSCTDYNVFNNDFRSIAPSSGSSLNVKELTNLASLTLANNYYLTDPTFSISASNTVLSSINISSTGLPLPVLIGRTALISITATYLRNAGSIFDGSGNYKFGGCSSLRTISLYGTPVTGAMPKFTNTSLTSIDMYNVRISGGDISGDQSFVIPEKTFELCPSLTFFRILSPSLLSGVPIHPSAFTYLPSLTYLYYYSYGRTSGPVPNLANCSNLRTIIFENNAIDGNIPNFAFAPNINRIQFTYNRLSGNIPPFRNLSNLVEIYLYNNRFTTLGTFVNLPNLRYFYIQNNLVSGEIPDFTDCPKMFYLVLFNNRFTNYKVGSFAKLYTLRYLDLSRNLLTSQAINAIISDLFDNYTAVPRGGVTVNIRQNAVPSGDALDQVTFLRSKGWTITF